MGLARSRRKVRGLRDIEKQVLQDRCKDQAEPEAASASAAATGEPDEVVGPAASTASAGAAQAISPQSAGEPAADEAGAVVLDYCAAVRGILNDDQGGPLHPPGLRMASALQEVRASLQRNLDAKKGGAARSSCAGSLAASTGGCRK
jgi:hypothetical protein